MFGYDDLKKDFEKLIDNDNLSRSYIFFGEPQLGKYLFSKCLANYLENKKFSVPGPDQILNEALLILPVEGTISIDQIRSLKDFLYKKPTFSKYRTVIVKDAENLTAESQNAMLKVLEEPPSHGLIILISNSLENLFPAILSRAQKIYFQRLSQKEIVDYLVENHNLSAKKAGLVAQQSFGRIGKAVEIITQKSGEMGKLVNQFLKTGRLIEYDEAIIDQFFEALIVELRKDLGTNHSFLRNVLKCLTTMKQVNVNKKLQLEALWQTKN
ncbi:MAG: AAA family ATPase [Candidatus Paceibacterota bacterium]|jgi:DNA polymerase-3 subunit delta'